MHDCIIGQLTTIDCVYTDVECQCRATPLIYTDVNACVVESCDADDTAEGYTLLGQICKEATGYLLESMPSSNLPTISAKATTTTPEAKGSATGADAPPASSHNQDTKFQGAGISQPGVLAGIVFGAVIGCLFLVWVTIFACRRRRLKKTKKQKRRFELPRQNDLDGRLVLMDESHRFGQTQYNLGVQIAELENAVQELDGNPRCEAESLDVRSIEKRN